MKLLTKVQQKSYENAKKVKHENKYLKYEKYHQRSL